MNALMATLHQPEDRLTEDRLTHMLLVLLRDSNPELFSWDRDSLTALWCAKHGSAGRLTLPMQIFTDFGGDWQTPALPQLRRSLGSWISEDNLFWLGVTLLLFVRKGLIRHVDFNMDTDMVRMKFTVNEGEKYGMA